MTSHGSRVPRTASLGHRSVHARASISQVPGRNADVCLYGADFTAPDNHAASAFAQALSDSRSLAGTDPVLRLALTDQAQRASDWHATAQAEINRLQRTGTVPSVTEALAGKATMDGFRAANASYNARLAQRRDATLSAQTWYSVGLAAALSIGLVLAGLFLVRRSARREGDRPARQRELRELLQVSESEHESRMLLIRHIERTVPGCAAAVFNRNNSDDRLEPLTSDRAEDTPLRGLVLEALKPRSCMAVRLSHPHERVAAIPDDASDAEQMIRKADRALYAAKAGGRNRVETAAQPGAPVTPSSVA
jgi:hypothetical protein